MKILHLTYMPVIINGIKNKLLKMAKIAKENNIPIEFIILTNEKDVKLENIEFRKIKYLKNIPVRIQKSFLKYILIFKNVDFNYYDLIIFRHVVAPDLFSIRLFKRFGKKIISEHHTNEIKEIKHRIRTFKDFLDLLMERFITPWILKHSKGIIGVTKEICDIELKKCIQIGKKYREITNGLDVKDIKFTGYLPFDGKDLNIIFVASKFSPWHGLNRLYKSLWKYNGDININLNVVGCVSNKLSDNRIVEYQKKNVYINYLGVKNNHELNELYSGTNLALGSLAMYKVGLRQACVLKIREYISRGLPFVYAYDDPDLEKDFRFCIRFPNDASLIDFNKVIRFAEEVSRNSELSDSMREYSIKRLSYKKKLQQYLDFCKELSET